MPELIGPNTSSYAVQNGAWLVDPIRLVNARHIDVTLDDTTTAWSFRIRAYQGGAGTWAPFPAVGGQGYWDDLDPTITWEIDAQASAAGRSISVVLS